MLLEKTALEKILKDAGYEIVEMIRTDAYKICISPFFNENMQSIHQMDIFFQAVIVNSNWIINMQKFQMLEFLKMVPPHIEYIKSGDDSGIIIHNDIPLTYTSILFNRKLRRFYDPIISNKLQLLSSVKFIHRNLQYSDNILIDVETQNIYFSGLDDIVYCVE